MRIVYPWLGEIVDLPEDLGTTAHAIALRGFEVAEVVDGRMPVIDFEITANRPDCLNHLGMAREAAVIWGGQLRVPEGPAAAAGPAEPLDVRIDAPDLCPRYCAQVFEVTVGPSPAWLADRLEAAGVRSINNIVDITNYVLLEMGQPMHAFDLTRLRERTIVVRQARPDESLRTLDGVDRPLAPGMLVIADAREASALGGIMGGAESEIGPATRLVALESACFQPASVRRTSRRLGLKTEASTRFERGGDVAAPPIGIARAAALLARLGSGRPLGPMIDRYPAPEPPRQVALRTSRIRRVLGMDVPAGEVVRILTPLGFTATPEGDSGWSVTVPSFRVDVSREIDLIEEVGRHHGFDRLPTTFPALAAAQPVPDPRIGRDRAVRRLLLGAGFSEAMTFAFIEREAAQPFADPGVEPAAIANPLSEKFAVLRPSLLPGLLDAYAHNRRRERRDVQLFETGSRFRADGEGRAAAFLWAGAAQGPHWSGPARTVDFFDVKGVIEALARMFGVPLDTVPADRPFLAPGRAAEAVVTIDGAARQFAVLGQLAPALAAARGGAEQDAVYVAEIDLGLFADEPGGDGLRAASLPRFPSIVRDLSMLFDDTLPAAAVRGTIRSAAPETLVSITEFDRYQGKGVPEGKISLSLRLLFRAADRTLTDDEVQGAMDGIVEALRAAHGGERR